MSTLTSKLDALYDQKHSLQGQLAEAKAAFAAKKNSAALEISRLSVSADSLAAEFRSLFAAAAAAHASGEGGEAAGLAAAGRTAQAACEAANAKAAELRAGLKTDLGDLRQNISSIRGQLDQLDANIAAVRDENAKRKQDRPKADPTKAIAVKGFHRAKGIDQRMVREVLSDLPPRLLAEHTSILLRMTWPLIARKQNRWSPKRAGYSCSNIRSTSWMLNHCDSLIVRLSYMKRSHPL